MNSGNEPRLFFQAGHWGNQLEEMLEDGAGDAIILNPRRVAPGPLKEKVAALKDLGAYVLVGYCGFEGLLYTAVGANAFASGNFHNLRRFNIENWRQATSGGKQRTHYFAKQLISTLRVAPSRDHLHLDDVFDAKSLHLVHCPCVYCEPLHAGRRPSETAWGASLSFKHFLWNCWNEVRLQGGLTTVQRIGQLRALTMTAQTTYDLLRQSGVEVRPTNHNAHVKTWKDILSRM